MADEPITDATPNGNAVDPDNNVEVPESTEAERALIEEELRHGQAVMKSKERLQKAQEKVNSALTEGQEGDGFAPKVWAGHVILQCLRCPLDVPADERDRMVAHQNATHPVATRGPETYDNLGNALEVVAE